MQTLLPPTSPRADGFVRMIHSAERKALARGRILVVDDEALVTDSLRLALEPAAYTVSTAASGRGALVQAEGAEWDLAFVDLGLPDMDGLDLLRRLKVRRPDLVGVVITGYGSGAKGFAARDAGAYAFLEKPADMTPEKILTVASNALRHRQAERELATWRQQVAASEKLATLGTLVSGVAHEIRTPLTYVTYSLYLARRELERAVQADPTLAGLAERVLKQEEAALDGVARISRLVEDLRRFTRRGVEGRADADLREVVGVAVDVFRAIRRERIAVETDLASVPALPLDSGQIQQVVFNLLNNSAEAMPAGGTVRIATRAVPGGGEIEVSDDGPGLSPEVEARLFDPFFTTKAEGTGLGLSICQQIVEAHGGQIRYATEVGRGTTFVIFLPARPG
ncbi:MAG TPA: ATP-binding protein [Methylomirabilota bacterium]|nr:ATP-binding protein [Methylomirabilota bacterium]